VGISKTTQTHQKIHKDVQSLPKIAEAETALTFPSLSLGPSAFYLKKDVSSFTHSFHYYIRVNIFLEIMSSKAATTHIFQSGVRIFWPISVSRHEIEVFNPQA